MANFNVPPYYDDYDEDKGYYKVLFRPSTAIQARELNQMQTMLQKQIERFGSHIFREGSIVVGGGFDLELEVPYVKAQSISIAPGNLQNFVGKTVVGQTSGLQAYVKAATYDADNNVYAFLFRYLNASIDTDVFLANEQVQVSDDASTYFTVVSSAATGKGSLFSIAQGVVFSKGYFIAFPTQTVILEKYSTQPTKTVGLLVAESFVTDLEDETILDNALGYPNENAPGAHRFKLAGTLQALAYKSGYDDPNFIPFMDLKAGVIETIEERSQYARIYDELAKRTYDESGDYYVRGLNVRTREHLDTGTNEGLYNANNGGDSTKLSIDIEPGIAYVKGYEVNKLVTEHIITDKSLDFETVNNQLINARTGGYFVIKEIVGQPDLDSAQIVKLYNTAETRITSNIKNTVAPTGVEIGTARVKALVYENGKLGLPSGTMRLYLYDFQMNAGFVISDARAVSGETAGSKFFADIVLTSGNAIVSDNNLNTLVFPLNSRYTRTIRNEFGSSDTKFQFNRTEDLDVNMGLGNGQISTSVSTVNEALSYAEGSLSVAEKRELIVSMNSDLDITLPGSITGTSGNTFVTGSTTSFENLSIGDRIKVDGNEYYINAIYGSANMQFTTALATSPSANVFYKALKSGDILDLTANGSSGLLRTVEVSSGTMTIDLQEDTTTTSSGTYNTKVTYRVERQTAEEIIKRLRANRFVKIDTSTNVAGTSGPFNLGLSDVYKIVSVRLHTSAFSSDTDGIDATASFVLDNGQKDNYYDHAKLVHIGSENLSTYNHILVKLSHFVPDYSTGFGYFSVDSYPVDDTQTSNTTIYTYEIPSYLSQAGIEYDLRDVLDFRPYKTATANSSITVGSATSNPATSTTFIADADGLRIVAPDSDITADFSFYLARRDVVAIDRKGTYNLIKGDAGVSPLSPNVPDDVMGLANIYIPPYPSVSETLSRKINKRSIGCSTRKIANIRYTMREIGVLKNRVENLEYYNALTLLEKNAVELKIVDENGLDRFKNGFFVDGFVDHSLGDTRNRDYKISIDKDEQAIRPFFDMESFKYKLETGASSGYQLSNNGNLVTRPYTETTLLENPNATTIRNIEQSVFRFIGTIEMTPDNDTWCDTETVDKVVKFGEDFPIGETMRTEWGSWETYSVGYNLYDRNVGDRSGKIDPNKYLGSYTSYAAAIAASTNTPYYKNNKATGGRDNRAVLETVTTESRTATITKVSSETQLEEFGNFVTDVSLIPYIRPQSILLYVRGIKANTRMYVYFDGELMSDYIVPIEIPDAGIEAAKANPTYSAEGSAWRSDAYGDLLGVLRLPEEGKRFRVGTKEVIVTDSPTNANDATTYAKAYFVANGLDVKKQNTIISTRIPVVETEQIVETRTKSTTKVLGPSCMAYSFKVDVPGEQNGIFLTSVDVWVEATHPSLGCWFEIREMNSAGGITRTQVPYSEKWLTVDDFNIASTDDGPDETNYTRVTFDAPVFLQNDTQYAFVIHTEGLNPDYYFWVSRLGEVDVNTGETVTSRALTGTLFTTNNNLNYDMVFDVDLTVRFNRALFTIGTGTVLLGNQPTEFITLKDGADDFVRAGETIGSSENLNLDTTTSGDLANSIIVTDIITGTTSGVSGNVIAIDGVNYYTDAFGFANNETYTVANSSSGDKGISGNLTLIESGRGTLRYYDSNENLMIIDNSNGKFYSNAEITGAVSGNTGRIESFSQWKYSTTTVKPYYLIFNQTACVFSKRGWDSNTSVNAYSNYIPGSPDSYSSFDDEMTILSRVNELDILGSSSPNSSAQLRAIMTTESEYVSPVIDLSRAQAIYVHNLLNNDATGEDGISGGNLLNRYISKAVTLADGQDAEDLIVKLTAYKPVDSDVKVWMKVRNDEDGDVLSDNYWIEMVADSNTFSSDANRNDFIDFDYDVPDNYKNGNGVVQYIKNAQTINANTSGVDSINNVINITDANTYFLANDEIYYSVPPTGTAITGLTANTWYYVSFSNSSAVALFATEGGANIDITELRTDSTAENHNLGGEVYQSFKQYKIKIGLMGTNSAKPPRVADLRVIALQT